MFTFCFNKNTDIDNDLINDINIINTDLSNIYNNFCLINKHILKNTKTNIKLNKNKFIIRLQKQIINLNNLFINKIKLIDETKLTNNFFISILLEYINIEIKSSKLSKSIIDITNDVDMSFNIVDSSNILFSDNKSNILDIYDSLTENNKKYYNNFSNKDNLYWGIGLENETYLQGNYIIVNGKEIINNLGRERYSINYLKNYNIEEIKLIMSEIYKKDNKYKISRMLNAHCFNKIDRFCNHKTTYEINPKPNPKFNGLTILDEWFEFDNEIKNKIDPITKTCTNIFFDGDTIEFITEKFYKTNTIDVVDELQNTRQFFKNNFNKFKNETKLWMEIGDIDFVNKHPGFNTWHSQPNKIVLFNNSTYHIHITLPTNITNGIISNRELFIDDHRKAIRMIQWFEPFLISTLGSPDIFQFMFKKNFTNNYKYAHGSLRATISKYIGIGTYNTNLMEENKILQKSIDEVRPTNPNIIWWRDMIKDKLNYIFETDLIGLDFNFSKHYQSGLEFRILDGFPIEILKDVLDILILLCEHALSFTKSSSILICNENQIWNNIVFNSMVNGYNATIIADEAILIAQYLRIPIIIKEDILLLEDFYYRLLDSLFIQYNISLADTKVLKYLTKNFTKINKWDNFNKIQCKEHELSLFEFK